jgi:hypothetical protein
LEPLELYQSTLNAIIEKLKIKPALVSQFRVHDDFFLSKDVTFSTPADKSKHKYRGLHAMVLIGIRATSDGRHMFLLQNWWKRRYFIEVSSEYLAKTAEPLITFIESEIDAIPKEFPVMKATYAETQIDISEKLNEIDNN